MVIMEIFLESEKTREAKRARKRKWEQERNRKGRDEGA